VEAEASNVGGFRQASLCIRDAKLDDIEVIVSVDDIARSDLHRVEFIKRAVRECVCVVAEVEGQVLGYGVLDHSFFGHGFISMVYVRSDRRRVGVGIRLVEHLVGRSKSSKVFTSTNESNGPMRDLLAGAGFEPSGIIHNLDPGDPELVYCKVEEVGDI